MNYLEYLSYSEFMQLLENRANWEFLVKFDSTLSINFGTDESGFYTGPNNTARPIDKALRKHSSSEWRMSNLTQNNCAIFAHEVYQHRIVDKPGKLNILWDRIPNYIPYSALTDCSIIDFTLDSRMAKDIVSTTESIQVIQTTISKNQMETGPRTIEYQILPPIKVQIDVGDRILSKLNRNNWNDIIREIKSTCIEQVSKVRTGIIDPMPGYVHDGVIIKSGDEFIIVQNDYQYNLIMSRDMEPINRLNTIMQSFERNRITQEKAIEQIDDLNNNFKSYFPNVAPPIYPKIIQQIEYTKIKISQR